MNYPLPDFERKILPPEQLLQKLPDMPRPLVFTNGCFDIIHRGHVTYLAQARALGECLILALNTDESVRRRHWPAWIGSPGSTATRPPR